MRALFLLGCLSLAAFAADSSKPFPLPSIDRKPIALQPGQKSFRVPLRFETVESFYRQKLADPAISIRRTSKVSRRTLTLLTRRAGDAWSKATVTEGDVDCSIDVQWVLKMGEQGVAGDAKPNVEFVLTRSAEVERQLKSIDHLDR